jgi:hypothetical protein
MQMDETTANVIAFLFVLVWAILIGRRIWLKKTKSRLENDVPKDVRQLIEPAREIQQKYRTPNPSDLLNVWGRISLRVSLEDGTTLEDSTTFIVFTHEDKKAGLSAIGYAESELLAKDAAKRIKDQPFTIFRFTDGYRTFNFTPLSEKEIASFNLPAKPPWLKLYGRQGNAGRPWRDDPSLVGKFHPGYPDHIEALFLFPEHGKVEKMWVGLVDIDYKVEGYIGKLLNKPHTPSSLSKGSRVTIRVTPGDETPIYISKTIRKNLKGWRGACQACGFDLVMIPVADFVRKTFGGFPSNSEWEMFTMRWALCNETMGVQKKKSRKKWWRFW